MKKFTHLHVHSEYSLLDGLIKIPDLVEKAKDLGMDSLALTDHGVMYGIYEFWSLCREAGIKPIIGVEAYIAERTRFDKVPKVDDKRYHIVLLAKNFEGYQNIIKLVTKANLEGFYYKPRIDKELIKKHGKGVIALSACMGGIVNKQIYNKQDKKARSWAQFLDKHFEEFYIEIQRNGIKEAEALIPKLKKLAKELDLPIVATADAHYINKEDWYAQEILWAISDGKKIDDDTRRQAKSEEFYIKSPKEMYELHKDEPEAVENTQKIADSIEEYEIEFGAVQPRYKKLKKGDNAKEHLRKLAFDGAQKRYGKITKKIKERIEYELSLIHGKGYDDYFLVVQDYVRWAMEQGILIGPGRGSGAGSVVAYSLDITNIDPFEFELYFERFLNPERESFPDFDIDFQDDRRDELFEYTTKTYGKSNTAFIGTFGRMKTRAAIRDVARVLDIDLEVADKLSKMVSVKYGKVTHMKEMIRENKDFREIIESDKQLKELSRIVQKIEGIARHVSTHACGYLITPDPISNYIPLQKETGKGTRVITQIEGYSLEPMGLMKFDFLGLTNLTIIQNALRLIKKFKGKDIDIYDIPLDDEATYKIFQKGETTAIFQFESDGMKKYLKELVPTEFEDLIFLVSAYRPGPMQYIHDYIERKFGRQEVTYVHPKLKPILKNTYGFAIYQEQVLRIAVDIAGYTLGEADILRRAMGKKKKEIMKQEKEKFIKGSMKNDISKDVAEEIFAFIEPFADYGFNKSHAASYALIAYQTAYLKTHYPVEFMAGLCETDIENSDKITRDILEADRMGIAVLPPHINKSDTTFRVEGKNQIRFGLAAVKNAGNKIIEMIVKERKKNGEFKSLDDLVQRVGTSNLNKNTLECLIKAGAMDQFGKRKGLLEVMPTIVDHTSKQERKAMGGQSGLFDSIAESMKKQTTPIPDSEESEMERLEWERDLIGTFLSSHPLKKYKKYFGDEIQRIAEIKKLGDQKPVKVGGFISEKKEIRTKKGNKKMAFIKITGLEEDIEGVVFNGVYEKYNEKFQLHKPYVFIGKTSIRENRTSVIVDELAHFRKFEESITNGNEHLELDISDEKDPIKLKILKQLIVDNPGNMKLVIYYKNQEGERIKKALKRRVRLTSEVKKFIENYLIDEGSD